MRVDRDAVRGIVLKVNRAHHLFAQIKAAQDAWNERQPYRSVVEQADPDGAKYFIRLHLEEPIPIEWSVILGEAIHDLRSALDQSVYWLTMANGGDPWQTSFPICSAKKLFDQRGKRGGQWGIRGIGDGPRAYIESLQPYPQRRGRMNYSLKVLHDLWNLDKHRLIKLWGFGVDNVKPHIAPRIIIPGKEWITVQRGRVIQHNAIAAAMHFSPPRQVQMNPEIEGRLATKNLHPTRREFGNNLAMLYDDTAVVVAKLLGSLPDQKAQIDPTAIEPLILPRGVQPDIPEQWP